MRVLVTGAGGFLGSHLVERLLADGHSVRALVRPANVPRWLGERGAELLVGDVTAPGTQSAAVADRDWVLHVASLVTQVNVPDSEYFRINAVASEALARRAAEAGARKFLYVSSSSVYPPNTGALLDEHSPLAPEDAYGRSKAEAERLLAAWSAKCGVPLVIVRPSRMYGPRDRSIVKIFRAIARRRFALVGPCTAQCDFLYVTDLVAALIAAVERGAGLYVIGGPDRVSVRRFFEEIAAALRRRLPLLRIPETPAMAASRLIAALWGAVGREPPIAPKRLAFFRDTRLVDSRRARRELGYDPRVGVTEGVRATAEWYRAAGWL